MEPTVHSVFESQTGTWQYVVACPESKAAAIIDPVLDLDLGQLRITTSSADQLLDVVTKHGYTVVRLLETHAHADHLTAAAYLQRRLLQSQGSKVPICTGHDIRKVQATFGPRYRVPQAELDNAFDHLFQDDEVFNIGNLKAAVLHLPGHTPDHSGYQIGSNVFAGDSIFNPDVGSARCDFPCGDASVLYQSMQRLLSLPAHYKLYTGHDYPPADSGREPMPCVTVAEQLERNKHVKEGTKKDDFINWRRDRDSGLKEPRLLHPALQVNIRGGHIPPSLDDSKGRTFLMMPISLSY
ncbi:probable Zn-dependent hydrolases, including glyoxylases [Cephalotrichum gorgonifer]|uniref:Probable Zn-dependent hydrolases, including glyoxylases n=1 Tax=Cephalotrichum gorgonifer TaxID=2041049 RepID=A0AAE8MYW4_9PEZI|nr:probable Zn-dependent hydrolases, including glyoxylases [Cephalotrichum gorgonifer]